MRTRLGRLSDLTYREVIFSDLIAQIAVGGACLLITPTFGGSNFYFALPHVLSLPDTPRGLVLLFFCP